MILPIVPALLLAVCLLLLVLYLQFRWRYRQVLAVASKLPCPPALPILGNAHLFLGDIVNVTKNLKQIATEYNGVCCLWIGPVPVFMVTNPADVQIILNSSSTMEKDDLYSLFKTFWGNSILSAPAHTWKKYRKLVNPVLNTSNVVNFLPVFNDVGRKLSLKLAVRSLPSDPTDDLFDMALDAIMETVISRKVPTGDTKKDIKYILDTIGRIFILRVFKIWLHNDWLFNFIHSKELKKARGVIDRSLDKMNQAWKEEENVREKPLDANSSRLPGINLLDVIHGNLPIITEDHDWRDEVITMVGTASDTTVASLAFIFVTLGHHQKVQDKIFEEIQEVMGDMNGDVTAADLNAMTYLNQVILESIRLHGSIFVIMRKNIRDTKLSGCTLPAGSRIMLQLYGMGWDKEQFPDPEQFLPERFSPEKQKERHSYSFLPFSAGPRNCIGKTYAMTAMKTVLVHVLRRLRVTSHTKLSDIEYELKVVMYSKTPLMVSFHPR